MNQKPAGNLLQKDLTKFNEFIKEVNPYFE